MDHKNNIENLFKILEGSFDVAETPSGHQQRFLRKLQQQQKDSPSPFKKRYWKTFYIAASVVLLIGIKSFFFQPEKTNELSSISPEMEQTQSFFEIAIHQELDKLKTFEEEDAKSIINDALESIKILEKDYDFLKVDLTQSGNDKRVIAAMIQNFQNRIEILQQVSQTLEEINQLKSYKNENTL